MMLEAGRVVTHPVRDGSAIGAWVFLAACAYIALQLRPSRRRLWRRRGAEWYVPLARALAADARAVVRDARVLIRIYSRAVRRATSRRFRESLDEAIRRLLGGKP